MELRPELYFPVSDSFIGAKPGLLTNENKKALEEDWYSQLETNK